jgi:hypothetical protein
MCDVEVIESQRGVEAFRQDISDTDPIPPTHGSLCNRCGATEFTDAVLEGNYFGVERE